MMISVDYHPSFQQIAFVMEKTSEYCERRLHHSDGEADRFYRDLQLRGVHVRAGMEASGYFRWFEQLQAEPGFEVWIGDPAEIEAKRVSRIPPARCGRYSTRLIARTTQRQPWCHAGQPWIGARYGCR
jgi:hypothetical protein